MSSGPRIASSTLAKSTTSGTLKLSISAFSNTRREATSALKALPVPSAATESQAALLEAYSLYVEAATDALTAITVSSTLTPDSREVSP